MEQFADMQQKLTALDERVTTLTSSFHTAIAQHVHGQDASNVNLSSLFGLFEVVSTAPTATPTGVFDQVKIYTNSTTYRLYWYDYVGHSWHYVSATA